jgi:hypothetical protein
VAEELYKYLNADGTCRYAPSHRWPLPHDGQPGDWLPALDGQLRRRHAYHAFRIKDLPRWSGEVLCALEHSGERLDLNNEVLLRGPVRILRLLSREEGDGAYMRWYNGAR